MGTTLSDLIQLLIQYMEENEMTEDLTPHFDGVSSGFVHAISWHESYTKGPRLYLKTYVGEDNPYTKDPIGRILTIGFGTDMGKTDIGECAVRVVGRHGSIPFNDQVMVTLEFADYEA